MHRSRLLDWLEGGRVVLGDGAMGSLLQAAGLGRGRVPGTVECDSARRDPRRLPSVSGRRCDGDRD